MTNLEFRLRHREWYCQPCSTAHLLDSATAGCNFLSDDAQQEHLKRFPKIPEGFPKIPDVLQEPSQDAAPGPASGYAPRLPRGFLSLLGTIPVALAEEAQEGRPNTMGLSNFHDRTITIKDGMHESSSWATLGHEMMHFILSDSGIRLSNMNEERVCDAFGTWFALAVQSKYLNINTSVLPGTTPADT